MNKILVRTAKGRMSVGGVRLDETPREVLSTPLIKRLIRDGSLTTAPVSCPVVTADDGAAPSPCPLPREKHGGEGKERQPEHKARAVRAEQE